MNRTSVLKMVYNKKCEYPTKIGAEYICGGNAANISRWRKKLCLIRIIRTARTSRIIRASRTVRIRITRAAKTSAELRREQPGITYLW